MGEWLARDPENGYLIGPDGCHYANEHQAVHYGLLKLCGCGSPDVTYNFCRDILACFKGRGYVEDAIRALIQQHPDEAAHTFLHLLTALDLLEHGSNISFSWLTQNGTRIIDMGPMTNDLMDQD